MIPLPWVSPEIVDQVLLYGRTEEPNEACGVVAPDSVVVKVPNSSLSPCNSFVIASRDLVNVMNDYLERCGTHPACIGREHFIIWHTHPSGLVGPSRGDMRERLDGFQYVVITLPNGEAVKF